VTVALLPAELEMRLREDPIRTVADLLTNPEMAGDQTGEMSSRSPHADWKVGIDLCGAGPKCSFTESLHHRS
jgi:hypothetical protein